jgi:hypothetical protein
MKQELRALPALAAIVTFVLAAGPAPVARGGDGSPIQKVMDQVNTRNRAIGKRLRAPAALEVAGRKGLGADAASLVRLGR